MSNRHQAGTEHGEKSNDEIVLMAVLLYEADQSDDEPAQRQRLAQMRKGFSDADLSVADSVCRLMWGDALPVNANADRLCGIARAMGARTTISDGYLWIDLPGQRAASSG